MSGRVVIAASALASAVVVIAYLALGGASYEPTPVADPCEPRAWIAPEGVEEAAQQFTLSALDGAACELGDATGVEVTRETLALALATAESRQQFAEDVGIGDAELEAAVRAGLERAIDDAEAAGALNGTVADGLRVVAQHVPVDQAIALILDARQLFENAQGILDALGGLLP